MPNANRLAPAHALEDQYTGLAQQLAKNIREYFQEQITKQQQEIAFLIESKKRKFASLTSAVDKASKKAQKSVDKFLS